MVLCAYVRVCFMNAFKLFNLGSVTLFHGICHFQLDSSQGIPPMVLINLNDVTYRQQKDRERD